MNIIEAYIKFKGQLIIFISGLPACGKLTLAKTIHNDFKLRLINQFNYYKEDYNVTTKLHDGTTLINWYTDDAVNWDKFNADIEDAKSKGVIVVGFSLPEDKLTVKPDYHIHISMPKQICMEKRKKYVEKHKDEHPEEFKILDTPAEKLKMNQLIYPYYLESKNKSKINKFINVIDMNASQIYDIAFDAIIDFIEDFLYPESKEESIDKKEKKEIKPQYKKEKKNITTPKVTDVTKPSKQTESESISVSGELLDKPQPSYDKELDMLTELSDPDDYDEEGDGPIKFVPVDEQGEWIENY